MPLVSQEHLDAQRRKILVAAMDCFAASGVHPTTMQQISRAAKVSIGAVYQYFPNKQVLIQAAFRENLRENLDWAKPAAEKANPSMAMRTVLASAFAMLGDPSEERSMRFGVVAQGEAMRSPETAAALAALYREVEGTFGFIIERGQREGVLRRDLDPVLVLRLIVAAFEGARIQQLVDPAFDARRIGDLLADLMLQEPAVPSRKENP